MSLAALQNYWWLLISILGATLVFLMLVQGGQTLLYRRNEDNENRSLMINSLGRKWELTFTTLVVFGGAFFASFPLFYSTSFGGAYWLWMLILISFVIQAVSYEYRRKRGNLYGTSVYDAFLLINGCAGCVLLGVAVGTFFFGGSFEVQRANIVVASSPVISQWAPTHGIEAIANWKCLLLGFMLLFLARMQGELFFLNNIAGARKRGIVTNRSLVLNGGVFVVLFLAFVVVLLCSPGLRSTPAGFIEEKNIYLTNLMEMWWCMPILLLGVVSVLYGLGRTLVQTAWTRGIWFTGIGTVLVVLVLFWIAGYNNTAYLPSITHPQSSLTIANSSSSQFTLGVMAVVSLLIPFVVAYIAYVWRSMDRTPITRKDVKY